MHALNRKNRIEIGVMTVVFVIAAVLVYKTTILTRTILPRMTTQVKAEEEKFYLLQNGDHIEQSFRYPSDELLSAGTRISLNEKRLKKFVDDEENKDLGALHLEIADETDTVIMSADYPAYTLADEQNLIASFDGTQTGWKNRKLTIRLDVEDIREELELAIGYTEKEVKDTALAINGEHADDTLNIQTADRQFTYWKKWGMFGAVLVYCLLLGSYLGLAVFRLKPEKLFLFTGAVLAVLYLLLLPPLSVPDEEAHYKQAYQITNRIMGKGESEAGTMQMDTEDFHSMQVFETTPSLTEYDKLKNRITKTGRESGVSVIPYSDTRAPAITYLPGVIGILLGRILGLNGLWVIYLGRICSVLCYLTAMYWFIRTAYFAKTAAFLMAVLPMTIQQCCSYSYDSLVIEFAFLYLAVVFRLIYEKKPIQKGQIVIYIVFMILLSICKGGTYMPLCLLTLLIPAERFSSKKRKWIFTGVMAGIAAAAFLFGTLSSVLFVVSPTAEQAAESYLAGETYGAAGLLSNPMEFVLLSVRTIFLNSDTFLENMFGMQLGWLDINVSRIVIYGLMLLIALSVLKTDGGKVRIQPEITAGQKWLCLFAAVCSVGMVFVSLFISWTPRESTEILGIQGRYFLPLLPLAIIWLDSKNIKIQKDISRKLMFAAVCLQCTAIYGILMSLERIL